MQGDRLLGTIGVGFNSEHQEGTGELPAGLYAKTRRLPGH